MPPIFWLLLPSLPVALWVAYTDLSRMEITNKSVLVMFGVFLVFGLFALPFETYLWRLLQAVVVLAIGFVINMLRLVGGGDAKYAAAIAPFFAASHFNIVLLTFAAMLVGGWVSHRILMRIPAVVRATPNWVSWEAC